MGSDGGYGCQFCDTFTHCRRQNTETGYGCGFPQAPVGAQVCQVRLLGVWFPRGHRGAQCPGVGCVSAQCPACLPSALL